MRDAPDPPQLGYARTRVGRHPRAIRIGDSDMTVVAQESGTLEAIQRPRSVFQRNVNLVRELSITSFKLKYTGSALGYVWSLVKPLMLFGIMYVVFSVLLKAGANTPDFPVQLLIAIVAWTFFTEATTTAMNAIAGNGSLIRKAYFPRWILVLASTTSALLTFVINTVLVVVITLALGHLDLTWRSLLAPLYFLELIVLVLGLSMLLSSLFVFFRDLGHIWEILSLVLFYGSAIVIPFSLIHDKLPKLSVVAGMNPIAQIVTDLRYALVDPSLHTMAYYVGGLVVIPILLTVVIFILGFVVFNRLTPKFAESL
jgi:ABC-2 type transport system permease protein